MCGVLGIYRQTANVANDIITGQSRLQHRGQESAGIAVVSGDEMLWYRGLGLVSQISREQRWENLPGRFGIGHNRYSTKGSTTIENAGPIREPSPIGPIAVSYNGNLINANQLRLFLSTKGLNFETTSDTEVIAQSIVYSLQRGLSMTESLAKLMEDLLGAYSLAVLTLKGLYAVRDPHGIRPLCLGELPDGYVISSETCSLELLGARFLREIERGEILAITDSKVESQIFEQKRPAFCVFEPIYIARPDSLFFQRTVSVFRKCSGKELASEEKAEGFMAFPDSITIPMPNTGHPAGCAWAWEMGIPPEFGCIKDRYNPERTFIMPEQRVRVSGVNAFTIISSVVDGKRVYMVDDSIVRGTTKRGIVKRLIEAGAGEVHGRITSPPYCFPCVYGVDTADRDELVAASKTVEEIREIIGLNSLRYLSLEGLYRALNLPRNIFCDACFTGDYPVEPLDERFLAKGSLEN